MSRENWGDPGRDQNGAQGLVDARVVLQACTEGCAVLDGRGTVQIWNGALEMMTGISSESALGKDGRELFLAILDAKPAAAIGEALAGRIGTIPEALVLVGERQPAVWCTGRVLPGGVDGKGATVWLTDISERRHQVEAQRIAERNYRAIFENAVGGLYQSTHDGRFLNANPAAAGLLGYESVKEMMASITDIARQLYVDPDARGRLLKILQVEGVIRGFEFRARRKDGSLIWLATSARLVRDGAGDPLFIEGNAIDITERKLAEEEIQRLATFPRFNPHPVLEFDRHGNLTYANYAAAELSRSFKTEVLANILPHTAADIVRDCLYRGCSQLEHPLVRDGRTLTWSFIPIVDNQVVHAYGIELTDKLNLEAQLRQAQKMDSIGQLAAGVAHDFNNLLTVIQGNTGLLVVEDNVPDALMGPLREIANAAERAANLTRQLLTFSRRQRMHMRPVDLVELLVNLGHMLTRLLGEHIELTFDYDTTCARVLADPGMLEQVVVNLSVNARDAMVGGGRLTVATRVRSLNPEEAGALAAGEYVELSLGDTGCGMSAEVKEHLFEPFFTTKDVGKGTGLGLATVYGIVQQHRGRIDVESNPVGGTLFRILLPALPSTDAVTPAGSEEATGFVSGSETILVVEDDHSVRQLVVRVLRRSGYKVLEADNGVAALRMWETHAARIELLLTDMVMPRGISGFDLARKLRADRPELRICFTSGYSVDMNLNEFAKDQRVTFLPKPYQPSTLAKLVRSILDGVPK